MTAQQLKSARRGRGWTQQRAAQKLGISQPYLSMLERGERRLAPGLARRFARAYELPPTVLPPADLTGVAPPDAETLARMLAALGYPGFAYLQPYRPLKNPAEVLLLALKQEDLEGRAVEALPWLLLRFWNLDEGWLVRQAKLLDLQNRLGFVTTLARRLSERSEPSLPERTHALRELEALLEHSRLAREDTLCKSALPESERAWVLEHRLEEARRWNLLTDWRTEHFSYA